jgi:hypothetical protein
MTINFYKRNAEQNEMLGLAVCPTHSKELNSIFATDLIVLFVHKVAADEAEEPSEPKIDENDNLTDEVKIKTKHWMLIDCFVNYLHRFKDCYIPKQLSELQCSMRDKHKTMW